MRELDRVVDQVNQNLFQTILIGADIRQVIRTFDTQEQPGALRLLFHAITS